MSKSAGLALCHERRLHSIALRALHRRDSVRQLVVEHLLGYEAR